MYADLTVERYLAGGFYAGRDLHRPMTANPMFVVSGVATAIAWANASRTAQATKPGPLGLIGAPT